MTAWVNGRFVDNDTPAISAMDRGLLLADGAFMTILLLDRVPVFWTKHKERLDAALRALDIEIPFPDEALQAAVAELSEQKALPGRRTVARVTVSRGATDRTLWPQSTGPATTVIAIHPTPPPNRGPVSAVLASIRRNEHSPTSRLKTLAYTDNILARREAAEAGAQEAIMLNTQGRLAGGSATNILLVRNGHLITPPTTEGCRPGVARSLLLRVAPQVGLAPTETPVDPNLLRDAVILASNAVRGPFRLSLPDASTPDSDDLAHAVQLCDAYDEALEVSRDDQR